MFYFFRDAYYLGIGSQNVSIYFKILQFKETESLSKASKVS